MTFLDQLRDAERKNGSMLCVGLDPEPSRFPGAWKNDAGRIHDFCAAIAEATADIAIAFKPQIAYFAAHRAEDQLERLVNTLQRVAPGVPVILDAKRGDIGSTAEQYAREAFDRYGADAVTLSPFMGFDSVEPYLRRPGKGAFLLCRTSNPGGDDFQAQRLHGLPGQPMLYERIAELAQGDWNRNGQLGLVVGATYPAEIERVRSLAPTLPLLIPGVGAQGGDAAATVRAGWREGGQVVVNSSRAILYASSGADFAEAARTAALATRAQLQAGRA
ncbi:orotidine-5'-phosphate decarboxylase [Xylophilus rhododendri]|uniref:Orotidine 5'-phosphate decarboxylase n=1 Tax=Xylophilus rhododendri TaxID=2697032 RepID=A0A857J4L9_9BURK|nr:orotidine-5'-phosphate decarboxylase [Xylophilus rhododendri]QHI98910.1 orotidine-5'-phosphate decarboxylase [Xylophilus rhododendri]